MHQDFAELTIAAVDSLFGQLTSRVFACLAYIGRCSIQDVVKETRLAHRQVGTTLVVLVQHHLAYHYTDENGQTLYEANGDTAYNIVFRYGKLAKAVGDCHGADAREVITKVALLGHTTPAELQRECSLEDTRKNSAKPLKPPPKINGLLVNPHKKLTSEGQIPKRAATASAIKSVNQLHNVLNSLLSHGYLCLTTEHQFMTENDVHVEAEHFVQQNNYPGGVKGGKEKQEMDSKVKQLKRKWRDEAHSYCKSSEKPLKRLKPSPEAPNGVTGRSAGPDDGANPPYFRLQDDIVMQLNFEKCNVIIRNQQLVNMANRFLGETTSKVYETVLKFLEPNIIRCYDYLESRENLDNEAEDYIPDSALPTSRKILEILPDDINLNDGISSSTTANGPNGHSSSRPLVVSDTSSDSDSDDPPEQTKPKVKARGPNELLQLERHLYLLQSDPRQFIHSEGQSWSVAFKRLTRSLIQFEIENTVLALHGQWAVRIIRILHKMYNTEEKTLVHTAILKPKDVRSVTNTLLAAGLIDTQEIPRDTNRTTNRLLWLYVYSPERARTQILQNSYRAMTRFLCRLSVERAARAPTIDKSERTDVIGNEDKYLTEKDKNVLGEWNSMEERVWCQVERLDDVVACMRDFAPLNDPYIGNRARRPGEEEER